jgi:hypothetical protein
VRLDSEELAGLAQVLERRFSAPDQRQQLLSEAGVDGAGDWISVVSAAQESGALSRLVQAASRRRPEDENLQAMAETLGVSPVPRSAFVAAGVVLLVLAGSAAAWYGSADDKINGLVEADIPVEPKAPPVLTGKPPVLPRPLLNTAPLVPPFAKKIAPKEALETPEETPTPETVDVGSEAVDGRCGGTRGELVGYWYAGFPFESAKGDSYTVKHGANVRKDHPTAENGWSAKAPIICSLQSGDTVRLSADPILIEGGKYWVPLHAGDLL